MNSAISELSRINKESLNQIEQKLKFIGSTDINVR